MGIYISLLAGYDLQPVSKREKFNGDLRNELTERVVNIWNELSAEADIVPNFKRCLD